MKAAEAIIGRGHEWTGLEKVLLLYTHCFRNRTHFTSGQVFDKEEFKEVCKTVQKPSEKPRVFTHTQRRWSERPRHPKMEKKPRSEDKECKGQGGTQLQHLSATALSIAEVLQPQPYKHCELTVNRRD